METYWLYNVTLITQKRQPAAAVYDLRFITGSFVNVFGIAIFSDPIYHIPISPLWK
jgi:hypothetical protein